MEKKKKEYIPPTIEITQGYSLFDYLDTDSEGYGIGEPMKEEEVNVDFEQGK